uniref:uncharacterized protein DDB_G0283697-like isoform X2 n=1 Tax=Myxine glutinosa TaxID=7769 RepID=UPI00358EEA86
MNVFLILCFFLCICCGIAVPVGKGDDKLMRCVLEVLSNVLGEQTETAHHRDCQRLLGEDALKEEEAKRVLDKDYFNDGADQYIRDTKNSREDGYDGKVRDEDLTREEVKRVMNKYTKDGNQNKKHDFLEGTRRAVMDKTKSTGDNKHTDLKKALSLNKDSEDIDHDRFQRHDQDEKRSNEQHEDFRFDDQTKADVERHENRKQFDHKMEGERHSSNGYRGQRESFEDFPDYETILKAKHHEQAHEISSEDKQGDEAEKALLNMKLGSAAKGLSQKLEHLPWPKGAEKRMDESTSDEETEQFDLKGKFQDTDNHQERSSESESEASEEELEKEMQEMKRNRQRETNLEQNARNLKNSFEDKDLSEIEIMEMELENIAQKLHDLKTG